MLNMLNRPVTRSISAELRARAALANGGASLGGSNNGSLGGFDTSRGDMESSGTETLERKDFMRDNSEELFFRTMLEGSSGQANVADVIGMLGSPQVNRLNSEELFHSWLTTNAELANNQMGEQPSSSSRGESVYRTRPATRRVSGDLAAVVASAQQSNSVSPGGGGRMATNVAEAAFLAGTWPVDNSSNRATPGTGPGAASKLSDGPKLENNKGFQDLPPQNVLTMANLLSSWLPNTNSSPVTRSRSSELRRLVAARGRPIPSTDELLACLATQGELGAALANMRPSPNTSLPSISTNAASTPLPLGANNNNSNRSSISAPAQNSLANSMSNAGSLEMRTPMSPPMAPAVPRISIPSSNAVSSGPPVVCKPPTPPTTGAALQGAAPGRRLGGGSVSAVVSMLKGSLERKKAAMKHSPPSSGGEASLLPPPPLPQPQRTDDGQFPRQVSQSWMPTGQWSTPGTGAQESATASRLSSLSPPLPTPGATAASSQDSPRSASAPPISAASEGTNGGPHSPVVRAQGPSTLAGTKRILPGGNAPEQPPAKRPSVGGAAPLGQASVPKPAAPVGGGTAEPELRKGVNGSLLGGPRPEPLLRSGSITSSGTSGGESSRHHRVERQRKMMEAKGRGKDTPQTNADVVALKKKVEVLETEVRSLKTFQSFMNRKDSEQTTRLEELEAKNAALTEERDRLLEELVRYQCAVAEGPPND